MTDNCIMCGTTLTDGQQRIVDTTDAQALCRACVYDIDNANE